MKTAIYVLTEFQRIKVEGNLPSFGDKRCVGYFDTFDEANFAVENNFHNIRDDMYDYAVVEEMNPGIKIPEKSRQFYKWDNTAAKYNQIPVPIEVADFSNFGIG